MMKEGKQETKLKDCRSFALKNNDNNNKKNPNPGI